MVNHPNRSKSARDLKDYSYRIQNFSGLRGKNEADRISSTGMIRAANIEDAVRVARGKVRSKTTKPLSYDTIGLMQAHHISPIDGLILRVSAHYFGGTREKPVEVII